MKRDKPGERGVIWRRGPLQKEHEVYVPPAGGLDIPAGKDAVQCRVGHDLQYLARARLIFSDPVIGAIQFRKIHSLHECTQKADRIVRWNHGVHFEWKFDLITGVKKRIIGL